MTIKNHFLLGRIEEKDPATGSTSFSRIFKEKLFLLFIKSAHDDQSWFIFLFMASPLTSC